MPFSILNYKVLSSPLANKIWLVFKAGLFVCKLDACSAFYCFRFVRGPGDPAELISLDFLDMELPFFFLRDSMSSENCAVTSKRVSRGATTFYARATIGVASDRSLCRIAVFLIRGEASV